MSSFMFMVKWCLQIRDNILEMLQDREIIAMED